MKHTIVFSEPGRYAGWPANNGAWMWDDEEILVGFTVGDYSDHEGLHNIREPFTNLLCRSTDGGGTWRTERPEPYVGRSGEVSDPPHAIDFAHPGFAMRIVGDKYHGSAEPRGAFFVSCDKGATWGGPYRFNGLHDEPRLAGMILTPRTDYIVESAGDCLVMLSAQSSGFSDKVFCARTVDGGRSFQFQSWVVPPTDPFRAVMPSTVRCADSKLVTALRRRESGNGLCWIDGYSSADGGRSWALLSKVGETGGHNGNPPALQRLIDGRLCCVYGCRDRRRIIARLSTDRGRTWGDERVIRDDLPPDADPDFGYPRLFQRADGRLVVMYYWATRDIPHQHIAATIWSPDE